MYFNWFFSTKANFKVCIEAQNILVAIFFHVNPYYYISTSVLNDTYCILRGQSKGYNSSITTYHNVLRRWLKNSGCMGSYRMLTLE